ncbi:MAG: CIA30 family protein, partial [Kiritimatiellae bacterium]|nr:CIA30 family protein [Kiritimatiellia bacterium]
CISYQSTITMSLQIVPNDEATLTEFNNYSATLAKSQTKTTVDLPWTKFKQQSGWGIDVDQEIILAQVNHIQLMFQG